MRTPIVTQCARCQETAQCSTFEDVSLCLRCVRLVIREWKIRHEEFGTLTQAQSCERSRATGELRGRP